MSETKFESEQDMFDGLGWAHLYGQHFYHSEAVIKGNRMALEAIRDAINSALENIHAEAQLVASDGEGYPLQIIRCDSMGALGTPEYLYQLEYKQAEAAHERSSRIRARALSQEGGE